MSNNPNWRRAFCDVVSIDRHLEDFDKKNGCAKIFADVVFRIVRVGGEPNWPLRFTLSLRKAEIHMIIPNHEPISIDWYSVERSPPTAIIQSITKEDSRETSQSGSHGLDLSISTKQDATIGGVAKRRSAETAREKQIIQEMREVSTLNVQYFKPSGHKGCGWDIEASDGNSIVGATWDARHPLAMLKDETDWSTSKMDPGGIRFEARCLSEDLIIDDVEIKQKGWFERLKECTFQSNKEMVVKQFIGNELAKLGLQSQNIDDKYGSLTLCDVIIT